MCEQHGRATQRTGRVSDPSPRDIGCASVHGLENSHAPGPQVGRRRHTQPAYQTGCQVRQDIAEQVSRYDHVEARRFLDQPHRRGIDQHLLCSYFWIAAGNSTAASTEKPIGHGQYVGFVDDSDGCRL